MVDALGDGLGVGLRELADLPPLPGFPGGGCAPGPQKEGGGLGSGGRRGPLTEASPCQACAPEDLRPQPPRLPEARLEHAACSHERPGPGAAGRPAVLCAR